MMSDKRPAKVQFSFHRGDVVRLISDLVAILDDHEVEGVEFKIVTQPPPRGGVDIHFKPLGFKDRTRGQQVKRERA